MKKYAELYKNVVRCTFEVPDDFKPEFAPPLQAVLITTDTGEAFEGGVYQGGKFYKSGVIAVVTSPELKVPLTQDQRDILLIKIAKIYGITGD